MKSSFFSLTLEQAMQLVPAQNFIRWPLVAPERFPSQTLQNNLAHMESFEMLNSEAAKVLLIDTLLLEVLPQHSALKVWKAVPLEAETVAGFADYLIAPKRAYI